MNSLLVGYAGWINCIPRRQSDLAQEEHCGRPGGPHSGCRNPGARRRRKCGRERVRHPSRRARIHRRPRRCRDSAPAALPLPRVVVVARRKNSTLGARHQTQASSAHPRPAPHPKEDSWNPCCSIAAGIAARRRRCPAITEAAQHATRARSNRPIHRPRRWEPSAARKQLHQAAAAAGVRRRFAPHQLRHAHAVEMAREGVPLVVIQHQPGHANLGITASTCRASTNCEIITTVHGRPLPTISQRGPPAASSQRVGSASGPTPTTRLSSFRHRCMWRARRRGYARFAVVS